MVATDTYKRKKTELQNNSVFASSILHQRKLLFDFVTFNVLVTRFNNFVELFLEIKISSNGEGRGIGFDVSFKIAEDTGFGQCGPH